MKDSIELPQIEESHVEKIDKLPWITTRSLAVLFVTWLSMLLLVVPTILPVNINVDIGEPSPQDVIAPKRIEDRYLTEQKRQEARKSISDDQIISTDEGVQVRAEAALNIFMDRVEQIQGKYASVEEQVYQAGLVVPNEWIFTEYFLPDLFSLNTQQNEVIREAVLQILKLTYKEPVSEDNLSQTVNNAIDELMMVMGTSEYYDIAKELLLNLIQPNTGVNQEAVEQARQEAADAVEPIFVQQGESIIRQGSLVSEREFMLLDDLGMLDTNPNWDLILSVSAGLLGLLILLVALIHLLEPGFLVETNKVMVIGLLIVLTLALGRAVIAISPEIAVMIPVPAATLIVAILFSLQLALAFGVVLGIMASFLVSTETMILLLFSVGSMVALFGSRNLRQRTDLLFIGFRIGIAQAVVMVFDAALNSFITIEVFRYAAWGLVSGLIAGFLALGLLPFLEGVFHLISALKLLELGNPNHPLLRKLMMEAPGSYQHSIMVANLSEIVCDEIGADSLLARVGAYFHDVGKSKRPIYFVENQLQKANPHDQLKPIVSASILFAHVKDGLELAREYQLPEQIQQFIRSHHGTTEAAYFYRRALNEAAEGETVNIEDFRYPGPKPPNREVAVVMLADTCEAAVRALSDPTEENISNLVTNICKERLNNGQLDDSDLTIRDLNRIIAALTKTLTSVYHRRIQYPPAARSEQDKQAAEGKSSEAAARNQPDPAALAAPQASDEASAEKAPDQSAAASEPPEADEVSAEEAQPEQEGTRPS